MSILLSSEQVMMNLGYRNQMLWVVYITICNLDVKTRCHQTCNNIYGHGNIQLQGYI